VENPGTAELVLWLDEPVPCIYAPCAGTAVLEFDGTCTFRECGECGGTWAHRLERTEDPGCQLGLAVPAQQAAPPGQAFLGGIGRRPG